MKNKKGSIFALAIIIITFVSLSYALGSFLVVKNKIKINAIPSSEVMDMYNQKTEDKISNTKLLELKLQQEFYEISKEGAVLPICSKIGEEYSKWDENCRPDSGELKNRFITEIKHKGTKTVEETGYVKYSIEYNYDSSVSIDLKDLGIYIEDFETIYDQAILCKKNTEISKCMKLKRWNVITKKEEGYVYFDLSTKQNFFFDNKFEPIILQFALKS